MMRAHANWLVHARLEDYLVAAGAVTSSLPVIGRYLEPVGGMAALSLWGARYLPDFMSSAKHRIGPGASSRRAEAQALASLMTAGLCDIVAAEALAEPWPISDAGTPWRNAGRLRRSVFRASVPYGDEPGQLLDVWRREDLVGPAPVLVFLPGGAWVFGSRALQGHELMAHLAELGWVCLSVQYRTSPRYRWPRQIIDVKAAIAWARANADQYGGDRNFVAVAGCSAGGHMASLAGLTPGEEQWQSELAAVGGHLGRRGREHVRPLRLGGPLDTRTGTVHGLPRARGGQAPPVPKTRPVPGRVAGGPRERGRATVPSHPR